MFLHGCSERYDVGRQRGREITEAIRTGGLIFPVGHLIRAAGDFPQRLPIDIDGSSGEGTPGGGKCGSRDNRGNPHQPLGVVGGLPDIGRGEIGNPKGDERAASGGRRSMAAALS